MGEEKFMQNHLQRLFWAALIALANPAALRAHDMSGTLGPGSSASDYYQIECLDDGAGAGNATYLEIALLTKTKNSPVVSLQVSTAEPLSLSNITDPINGDSSPSRVVDVANDQNGTANGSYYVSVNKTQAGVQSYHFTYHCMGEYGHAGTQIGVLQNQ
jgi:myo-inositol-hexaphosphate 3-phosphohydrolase